MRVKARSTGCDHCDPSGLSCISTSNFPPGCRGKCLFISRWNAPQCTIVQRHARRVDPLFSHRFFFFSHPCSSFYFFLFSHLNLTVMKKKKLHGAIDNQRAQQLYTTEKLGLGRFSVHYNARLIISIANDRPEVFSTSMAYYYCEIMRFYYCDDWMGRSANVK